MHACAQAYEGIMYSSLQNTWLTCDHSDTILLIHGNTYSLAHLSLTDSQRHCGGKSLLDQVESYLSEIIDAKGTCMLNIELYTCMHYDDSYVKYYEDNTKAFFITINVIIKHIRAKPSALSQNPSQLLARMRICFRVILSTRAINFVLATTPSA